MAEQRRQQHAIADKVQMLRARESVSFLLPALGRAAGTHHPAREGHAHRLISLYRPYLRDAAAPDKNKGYISGEGNTSRRK